MEGAVDPGGYLGMQNDSGTANRDVLMEDSKSPIRPEENGSKVSDSNPRISYREAFLQASDRLNSCFHEWGIGDLENNFDKHATGEVRVQSDVADDIPFVEIYLDTKKRIIQPWKYCLIGKVLGKTIGYQYMSSKTREFWKLAGKMQILDMGCDFFMFKFERPEDFKHALLEGTWFINGRHLSLRRWTTNFKPSEASIHKTVVWDRLRFHSSIL